MTYQAAKMKNETQTLRSSGVELTSKDTSSWTSPDLCLVVILVIACLTSDSFSRKNHVVANSFLPLPWKQEQAPWLSPPDPTSHSQKKLPTEPTLPHPDIGSSF